MKWTGPVDPSFDIQLWELKLQFEIYTLARTIGLDGLDEQARNDIEWVARDLEVCTVIEAVQAAYPVPIGNDTWFPRWIRSLVKQTFQDPRKLSNAAAPSEAGNGTSVVKLLFECMLETYTDMLESLSGRDGAAGNVTAAEPDTPATGSDWSDIMTSQADRGVDNSYGIGSLPASDHGGFFGTQIPEPLAEPDPESEVEPAPEPQLDTPKPRVKPVAEDEPAPVLEPHITKQKRVKNVFDLFDPEPMVEDEPAADPALPELDPGYKRKKKGKKGIKPKPEPEYEPLVEPEPTPEPTPEPEPEPMPEPDPMPESMPEPEPEPEPAPEPEPEPQIREWKKKVKKLAEPELEDEPLPEPTPVPEPQPEEEPAPEPAPVPEPEPELPRKPAPETLPETVEELARAVDEPPVLRSPVTRPLLVAKKKKGKKIKASIHVITA